MQNRLNQSVAAIRRDLRIKLDLALLEKPPEPSAVVDGALLIHSFRSRTGAGWNRNLARERSSRASRSVWSSSTSTISKTSMTSTVDMRSGMRRWSASLMSPAHVSGERAAPFAMVVMSSSFCYRITRGKRALP